MTTNSHRSSLPRGWRVLGVLVSTVALGFASPALAASEGDEHAEVNWYYGILGESDEISEPSVLWRMAGMPVPLAAQFFNSFLLFYLLYRFGKKPVVEGLRSRREAIMKGMDSAAAMKAEAERELNDYEAKLGKIDAEIERVRREMRAAAEAERAQVLAEAKKRRERLERDAKLLIQQELKAARETLMEETVRTAVQSAEGLVKQKVTEADHQRLSEEYLASLRGSIGTSGWAKGSKPSSVGGAE